MLPWDCYLCQNSKLDWSAAQIVSAEVDAVQTEGNNPVAVRDTEEQAKNNSQSLSLSLSFSFSFSLSLSLANTTDAASL